MQKAGFPLLTKRGKGSHYYWFHPLLAKPAILSGKDGSDAKLYQEKNVMAVLEELARLEEGDV